MRAVEYRANGITFPSLQDAKDSLPDGGVIVKTNGKTLNPDRPDGAVNIARWFSTNGKAWTKAGRV